ncbi:hypothetical protein NO934_14630 [Pelagibacterium sp. H642]|nr:hypothetical protein NO934_14630 [Pelagibacterium sp. H642]
MLRYGEPATIISRNTAHAAALKAGGATLAEADIRDVICSAAPPAPFCSTRLPIRRPTPTPKNAPTSPRSPKRSKAPRLKRSSSPPLMALGPASGAATSRCSMNSSSSSQHCLFPSPSIVARIT